MYRIIFEHISKRMNERMIQAILRVVGKPLVLGRRRALLALRPEAGDA